MKNNKLRTYFYALRINQWLKNFVIFTAIIFSGQLFHLDLLLKSISAFFIFCLLSSTSYVLNDIIDYPFDKKHPIKKFRPVASGDLSMPEATFIVFVLSLISLMLALSFSLPFFFLSLFFILLHFFYSFILKKQPVVDIFTISFSFMIRTFAGEIATGYHIPIWLLLTIFFGSLFMASVKRHAELVANGIKARLSLYRYNEHFLDFLTYTFGTATIIAYSTYTYVEKPPQAETEFSKFFVHTFPGFEARKWLMISIPIVVYGVARYAQLLYEKAEGERPERTITTDIPLIVTIALWGIIIISLIYLL
ncbi:MAG: UbiA prenyltransferase family protein [Patescibacteria group bacterium]|jgi:4-hydroxybenzoate polyprenyltransferase